MKSYLTRVILCLVPVVISAVVVGWAVWRYQQPAITWAALPTGKLLSWLPRLSSV